MKQAIVVDSSPNHRSTLMHQLSQSDFSATFQFKTLAEAHNKLFSLTMFSGVILVTVEGETTGFSDFLRYLRFKHPDCGVVAVTDSLSLSQMRSLISLGVDHVLLRPFNVEQLKNTMDRALVFRSQVINDNLKLANRNFFDASFEKITEEYFKVSLRGWLAENCELPNPPLRSKKGTLFIDCDQLKGINSIGIRSWILWFKSMSNLGFTSFELDNVRGAILQQTSFVKGFLPDNSVVNSFYLYYGTTDLSEEREFKISFGKHYGTTQMRLPKFIADTKNDKTVVYELEDSVLKLLKFYKGTIEIFDSPISVL